MEVIEHIFNSIVQYSILMLECAGVVIIVVTTIQSFGCLFRKDSHVRLKLAQGIALALEFKLGSEVLRTVIVRDWNELAILGAIILLRGLLTFIIHWEIKTEESRLA